MKTIYFDTETSGLDCRNCKIIELAMLIDEDGQMTEYDEFVDIGEPLHPRITKITGITNAMLVNDGEKEENVAADEIVSNVDWLDTLSVLKDRKEYPHKLVDAVDHYHLEKVNFHRAIDDTKALYLVTQEMINERDDLYLYINKFGYNPKYGVSGPRFPFIKYRSQPYHNRGLLPPEDILPKK